MTVAAACALWLAEAVLLAALASRPLGARVAVALAVVLLPWPAFVDAATLWRSVFAVGAFWCVVRSLDFALDPVPASFLHRLLHLFAIIDTRLVGRGERVVPPRLWLLALLSLAAFGLSLALVRGADGLDGAARLAMRWSGGIMLLLSAFEALTALFRIATALLGLRAPRLSDAPLLARSIAEFWSARWNLVVGKVLRDRVFTPLARRGPALAVWATFGVSAAFHAYLTGVALAAAWPAASAALFFLLQPPLLAAERRLRIRRRRRVTQHAWTLGSLTLLSPLFTEPVLRMLGFE